MPPSVIRNDLKLKNESHENYKANFEKCKRDLEIGIVRDNHT